jgi:hypothetical protein
MLRQLFTWRMNLYRLIVGVILGRAGTLPDHALALLFFVKPLYNEFF